MERFALQGAHIRLDPLESSHLDALVSAVSEDTSLYQWSMVPRHREAMQNYVSAAIALREAGLGAPFAIVRMGDAKVIGSTRFFDLERWAWPQGHARHARGFIDGCEIGYTWLAASAIRTAANTEAKLLMLSYAFESWNALRVSFHTDVRNERSAAAIERIGGKREGILRSHRMAVDFTPRDSLRFSIIAAEWPEVKRNLRERLERS